MDKPKKPWFGPKLIGWGVGPKTWQGWLITAIFIGICLIIREFTMHR